MRINKKKYTPGYSADEINEIRFMTREIESIQAEFERAASPDIRFAFSDYITFVIRHECDKYFNTANALYTANYADFNYFYLGEIKDILLTEDARYSGLAAKRVKEYVVDFFFEQPPSMFETSRFYCSGEVFAKHAEDVFIRLHLLRSDKLHTISYLYSRLCRDDRLAGRCDRLTYLLRQCIALTSPLTPLRNCLVDILEQTVENPVTSKTKALCILNGCNDIGL
ncbi:MAG: hypothetical protein LBL09_00695 [Oscillospiraceae bacterium]|jgi:hypothetical protein|nr:hypothetical protein [Oscillospiraceae bacterium]